MEGFVANFIGNKDQKTRSLNSWRFKNAEIHSGATRKTYLPVLRKCVLTLKLSHSNLERKEFQNQQIAKFLIGFRTLSQ